MSDPPISIWDSPPVGLSETAPVRKRLSQIELFFLSCLWLAYSLQWGALIVVILPSQVAAIVGTQHKEFYNALILSLGACVAMLVVPLAGAMSDRCRSRFGPRRPYLLAGCLTNMLFLALMAGFGPGSNIWLFALCSMGLQFGSNAWGGPYAGLIPDRVPPEQRGAASGWMSLMSALGTVIGAFGAGQLLRGGHYAAAYVMILFSLMAMLALTLWRVREEPKPSVGEPFEWKTFFRTMLPDGNAYRDFYWVLLTRGMVTMGVYSVLGFFQYFLGDVIHAKNPVQQSSLLLGIITLLCIPTSLIAGPLSDRYGRKPLIYFSGSLMSLGAAIYVLVAFFPSLAFTFVVAGVFGIGYGAYLAVDWALAIDVLPPTDDAAKDMGIWHASMALPQIVAPMVSGVLLNALKSQSLLLGYSAVFALAAFWFIMGTVFVRQVRSAR